MSRTTFRTRCGTSTYAWVVISPATRITPVVVAVSQATRELGSWRRHSSSMPSDTWSQSLSGWPSVTDSLVKRTRSVDMKDSGIGSGPCFPRPRVLGLRGCHFVDLHSHGLELAACDLFVQFARHGVDLRCQSAALRDKVLDREGLIREGHVHHGRRVPLRGGEIHEAALAEDDDAPAVPQRELLDERPQLAPTRRLLAQRPQIDLVVEVARVRHDCAVLEIGDRFAPDEVPGPGGGHEEIPA